jgi:hypothetical protein
MSLSAREQQALDSITDRLAGTDAELAALLTGFTRLVSDEEMPLRERIRAGSRRAVWRSHRQRGHRCGDGVRRPEGRASRRLGLQWAALLLSLLTAVTVITVTMALNHGRSQGACTTLSYMACAGSAPPHSSRPAAHETVTNRQRSSCPPAGQRQRAESMASGLY